MTDHAATQIESGQRPKSAKRSKSSFHAFPPPHVYRPDIDGLRTLAVVPVLLFHAYPERFPSGFIGVDIFFVISGFLISGILFKQNANGTFSYADFYSRRIRRIYPTLLIVLVVTWLLGCLYLLADKLKALVSTLLAGTLFGANLQVMLLERGYFDDDIKTNPLLHLWSLGVEEQFYIFWPFFASWITRASVPKAISMQVVAIAASFLTNVVLLHASSSNKYAFYFPLSRFWQMGVGGLLAYLDRHPAAILRKNSTSPPASAPSTSSLTRHALSVAGLGFVLLGFAFLDESSAFPGFWALLPTFGAAFLIAAGPQAWLNRRVLSCSPVIYVGKLSYALYLWHWPLLVFAKLRYPNAAHRPAIMSPLAMLALSALLSCISLHGIENAVRHSKSKFVIPGLLAGMLSCTFLAAAGIRDPVAFSLTQQDINHQLQLVESPVTNTTTDIPVTSRPTSSPAVISRTVNATGNGRPTADAITAAIGDWNPNQGFSVLPATDHLYGHADDRILNPGREESALLVVLGDSHAEMLKPRFLHLFQSTDKPFPTVVFKAPTAACPTWWSPEDLAAIQTARPHAVLIGLHWLRYFRPGGHNEATDIHNPPRCCDASYNDTCADQSVGDVGEILARFQTDVAALTGAGIPVYVTTVNLEGQAFDPLATDGVPLSRSIFRQTHATVVELVEAAIARANATMLDLSENQCWNDMCAVVDTASVPIMINEHLFRSSVAATYLSVLDVVVTAALANTAGTATAQPSIPKQREMFNTAKGLLLSPPTYAKIIQAVPDWDPDFGYSPTPQNTIYAPWHEEDYELNPGQPNVIMLWGDSHANMLKPRFLELFTQHTQRGGAPSGFPSIVAKTKWGRPMLSCFQPMYDNYVAMIKATKPKVLLHSLRWIAYLNPGLSDDAPLDTPEYCVTPHYEAKCMKHRPKDVTAWLKTYSADLAAIGAQGTAVFAATMNPEGYAFMPEHMLSGSDVVDVKSVDRAAFRKANQFLVESIERAIHDANVTMLDYSEHYCWNDVCEVLTRAGEPVMRDHDHFRRTYVRDYVNIVDQLVEAAMAK
ncbi:Aste57867_9963 [Aphanomyces stellatus]|uniref:Aste57867_9963 protein n=1 Tax=Aphanomyces stellatus TaxID=120398 RepID=A0A485KPI1_9STRA|nr:hypothetical protein As57867_009924 [Aphanomyces stellatus]VFT86841.1 Aste57867_9963 [Aphanomyces stellatus]